MKRSLKILISCVLVAFALSSCAALINDLERSFSNRTMSDIELGMTQNEVIRIMGRNFTVAEKRIENGNEIEVLSYTLLKSSHFPAFYLFRFNNGRLEELWREIPERPETIIIKQE